MSRPKPLSLFYVLLLPLIWGTTFAIVKIALGSVSPLVFASSRFLGTGLLFLFTKPGRDGARMLIRPRTQDEREIRKDSIILGLSLGAGYVLQTFGLLSTTTSKSAFLTSTTVIWTPLLAYLIGRERHTYHMGVAILLTIAGIYFMTHPFGDLGFSWGDMLTVGCAIAFSVYIAWIDRTLHVAERLTRTEAQAGIMMTCTQLLVSGSLMFIAIPFAETPRFDINAISVGGLVYCGVLATAFTAYLQTVHQREVSPSTAAVIFMLEPVVAVIIGYAFLHERMGLEEAAGAILIVIGVIVAQLKPAGSVEPVATEANARS